MVVRAHRECNHGKEIRCQNWLAIEVRVGIGPECPESLSEPAAMVRGYHRELYSVCQKKVGGLKNGETRPFDTRSIHL